MKENVISVKLSSFTKDKVKSLISIAEKNIAKNNDFALKCLREAERYIRSQYRYDDVYRGALFDLFGYGTGCPLLHTLKRDSHDDIIFFFIKIGVNPSYKKDLNDEFYSFG